MGMELGMGTAGRALPGQRHGGKSIPTPLPPPDCERTGQRSLPIGGKKKKKKKKEKINKHKKICPSVSEEPSRSIRKWVIYFIVTDTWEP